MSRFQGCSACGTVTVTEQPAKDAEALVLVPTRRKKGSQRTLVHIECDCRPGKVSFPPVQVAATAAEIGGDSLSGPACPFYASAAQAEWRLYSFEEAPPTLQYNKYIRTGYRAGLSYGQCLGSMLCCHNETGNILTHLLPALFMLGLLAYDMLASWPHARLEYWQNWGSILLCFCLSVAYHTFLANHHHYQTWLKLDVCGVLLVLVGGGHMVLWWGFHCHPTLRLAFALCYYTAGAACVFAAVNARSSKARAACMLSLLLLRVGSFVVRLVVSPHASQALWHYFAMEAYSLVGGAVNALRVPERWFQPRDPKHPGPLDYWLNSHQIMHVMVALAMLHLHLGATHDYHLVMSIRQGTLQCAAPW